MIRLGWLALGCLFVGLGMIGAVLPLMPTTIFLILATGCFARSSPRLEAWLLNHPRFGPTLRDWRERGAILRREIPRPLDLCGEGQSLAGPAQDPVGRRRHAL